MYTRTSGFRLITARCPSVGPNGGRAKCVSPACRLACQPRRGVAQLAEQRSPKPQVAGSSPVAPAQLNTRQVWTLESDPPEPDERHAVSDERDGAGSASDGTETEDTGDTRGQTAVVTRP